MKLYNTLTRQIEEITPLHAPEVTVYTCGPTVYDYPHIGNWFTFLRYDLLVSVLRLSGLQRLSRCFDRITRSMMIASTLPGSATVPMLH